MNVPARKVIRPASLFAMCAMAALAFTNFFGLALSGVAVFVGVIASNLLLFFL